MEVFWVNNFIRVCAAHWESIANNGPLWFTKQTQHLSHERAIAPPKDLFSQGLNEGLKKTSKTLEQLISDVPNCTLQNLFENVIRKAGILSHVMQSKDKIWFLQVLTGLFDFIREETARNPSFDLKQLVHVVSLMEDEGLVLPLTEICGNEKGVSVMTAHGSKGLEFEHIFFAGCNATYWEKKRKPYSGYKLPDTIFSSISAPISGTQGEIEELRRLFYVALTRAEQHLVISYCCFRTDGSELEPSMNSAQHRLCHSLHLSVTLLSLSVKKEGT